MIDEFKNDLPFSKRGFGLSQNHYVSGRTTVLTAAHGGICHVSYIGAQDYSKQKILQAPALSVFVNLARLQVEINGTPYRLEFHNTTHHIFGYISECELDGVKLKHEMLIDQNVVFQRVSTVSNPQGKQITARLVHSADTWYPEPDRTGCKWIPDYENNVLNAKIADKGVETSICIGGINPCRFIRTKQTYKFYLQSDIPADSHSFYIAFNNATNEDLSISRIDRVWTGFNERIKSSARFHTGNAALDSSLFNTPELMSNLECTDCPGAFRASPFYWIWGWDAMVHSEGIILCGYPDIVKRTLFFFKEHATPGVGIAHAYPTDYYAKINMVPATQGFYSVLLWQYYLLTGDQETLDACLPFAKEIMERAKKTIREKEHLLRWAGLFPDDPFVLEQTNEDFSVFNNSVYYQSICAWNELTGEMAEERVEFERQMSKVLWNEKVGFWVDSTDGKTGAQREYYPCYGQVYITQFALRPHHEDAKRIASFMKKNFLHKHGIWQLNLFDKGFMADGGQQGKYFPVTDRYYWNMMNETGDIASLDDYERIISSYWQLCAYPEGETNEIVNTDLSEYEDEPGMKQLFTAKAWLCDALEVNLGLRIGKDGIAFNPMGNGKTFSVEGLLIRGSHLDVKRTGKGLRAEYLFNGEPLAQGFLGWSMLKKGRNALEIKMR